MKSTHKKYHRKLEWPDKTQKILPDLFLERQESKSQSLTDSKNDENVTANSKLYLQMFKEDFFKDSMLHNMLETHLYRKQTKIKSENQLHSEIQLEIQWIMAEITCTEFWFYHELIIRKTRLLCCPWSSQGN